jgi:two-component system sensor histidine kinase KdpD
MVVNVSDEGTGLTTAEKAKMWDRFARGERHALTTSGSGLGLWIANAFIDANGGKITAESAGAGFGTTISIALPITLAAVPQMESDADE